MSGLRNHGPEGKVVRDGVKIEKSDENGGTTRKAGILGMPAIRNFRLISGMPRNQTQPNHCTDEIALRFWAQACSLSPWAVGLSLP